MPARVSLSVEAEVGIAVPVPSTRRTSLIVVPKQSRPAPDLALLQHVATIAALELERCSAQRAQRLRLEAELLAEMLDVPLDPAVARRRLAEHGIPDARLVLATWGPIGALDADVLHDALNDAEIRHLLLRREDAIVTLQGERHAHFERVAPALPAAARVGVSDAFTRPAQASDAIRQAVWAQQAASAGDQLTVRYGEHHAPFLPRTLTEAQDAVQRVLGSLIVYDREHETALLHTLRVFLECNRSWKRAAALLYVHKQTLVYRIRRVEDLTAGRLDDTQHVAELWFALRTLELSGGLDDGSVRTNV